MLFSILAPLILLPPRITARLSSESVTDTFSMRTDESMTEDLTEDPSPMRKFPVILQPSGTS